MAARGNIPLSSLISRGSMNNCHGSSFLPLSVYREDVSALVTGATLLGCGGGGDPRPYFHVLNGCLGPDGVQIYSPDRFQESLIVPIGFVGATTAELEKLPGGDELPGAVNALLRWCGKSVDAVMSIEGGGVNGLSGLIASLQAGLPYVDADLMGRAMPRLDQFSWSALNRRITPCALCEPGGRIVVFDHVDAAALERQVRALLSASGGWAALALCPAPAAGLASSAILGSTRLALALGRRHESLPEAAARATVESVMGAVVIGAGLVHGIDRTSGPAMRSSLSIIDEENGDVIRIEGASEYLLALVNGKAMAATPDLICVLDRRTCQPLSVGQVRTGTEVLVITMRGPEWWYSSDSRLQISDLRGFDLGPIGPDERY